MKLKVKVKNGQMAVVVKLTAGFAVDERELGFFSRRVFRGFLKVDRIGVDTLECTGPGGTSLSTLMTKPISKSDFLYIVAQLADNASKLQKSNYMWNKAIWDTNYIYYNPTTKEVLMIYLPLVNADPQCSNPMQLLINLAYGVKVYSPQDPAFVTKFINFLRGMRVFNPQQLLNFVQAEDKSVVNVLKRSRTGVSSFITDKQKDYYNHYANQGQANAGRVLNAAPVNGNPVNNAANAFDEATERFEDDTDLPTGLLSEKKPPVPQYQPQPQIQKPMPQPMPQPVPQPVPQPIPQPIPSAPPVNTPADDGFDEATGLLTGVGSSPTDVLPVYDGTHYPSLIRIKTNEVVYIDKPVFRIGKEKSYVDYFVSNNNAVSRSHADIVTRGKRCFVIDLNSKNRTYINGEMLPIRYETEIFDGDILRLGNEEFIFKV